MLSIQYSESKLLAVFAATILATTSKRTHYLLAIHFQIREGRQGTQLTGKTSDKIIVEYLHALLCGVTDRTSTRRNF